MEWDILSKLKLVVLACFIATVSVLGQSITGDRVVLNPNPCTIRVGSGAPVNGTDCDVYIRYDNPNYGVYQRIGGSWLKVAHSQDPADLPTVAARTDVGNIFTQEQHINVNSETLEMYPVTGTSGTWARTHNTGETLIWGVESSTGGSLFTGTNAYAGVFGVQGAHDLSFATNNTMRLSIDSSGNLLPYANTAYNIGSPTRLWNHAYFSTMDATVFAKSEQVIYGGWLAVSKNAGTLGADVAVAATTVNFGTTMTANQFVVFRSTDGGGTVREEYMKVGTLVSGTTYNVTRDLANANPTNQGWNWLKGTPYQVRGVAGDQWVELSALSGGRLSLFTQGSAYNNSVENIRIGDLSGMPNSSSGIGTYMGDATNYFRWDGTNLNVHGGSTKLDNSGLSLGDQAGLGTYTTGAALKYTRATTSGCGSAGDLFSLYSLSDAGSQNDLRLDNVAKGCTNSYDAHIILNSQGWKSSGSPGSNSAASIDISSPITGGQITLTAPTFTQVIGPLTATSSIADYSRTVGMGDWTDVANSSANFATDTGSAWTVTSGSQVTYAYMMVGHTMTIQFWLDSTNVTSVSGSGAPAQLWLTIPASKTCTKRVSSVVAVINANGTEVAGNAYCNATDTIIRFQSSMAGAGWTHTAGNDTFVRGQITIPIS